MTKKQYQEHVVKDGLIGFSDNTQFVMPIGKCEEVVETAGGDISKYEALLGFDEDHFAGGDGLVRIDIEELDGLNLRMASGNEEGANNHWIPGGKTDGGILEAVTDRISKDAKYVKITELL